MGLCVCRYELVRFCVGGARFRSEIVPRVWLSHNLRHRRVRNIYGRLCGGGQWKRLYNVRMCVSVSGLDFCSRRKSVCVCAINPCLSACELATGTMVILMVLRCVRCNRPKIIACGFHCVRWWTSGCFKQKSGVLVAGCFFRGPNCKTTHALYVNI